MATTLVAERRAVRWQALGQRLARARQRAGLTQEQLAERLGVTQGHVANVEGGGKRPKAETLQRWAEALGEPVGELLVEGRYVTAARGLAEPDLRSPRVRRFAALPDWLQDAALESVDAFLKNRPRQGGGDDRSQNGDEQ